MASKSEKTERRWIVIKSLLIGLVIYTIAIIGMHLGKINITPLDHLTTMIFGLVGAMGVGNWMTKPIEDDEKKD
jgi:hypothetical protein